MEFYEFSQLLKKVFIYFIFVVRVVNVRGCKSLDTTYFELDQYMCGFNKFDKDVLNGGMCVPGEYVLTDVDMHVYVRFHKIIFLKQLFNVIPL